MKHLLLSVLLACPLFGQIIHQAGDPGFPAAARALGENPAQLAFRAAIVENASPDTALVWAACWHSHDADGPAGCKVHTEPYQELAPGASVVVHPGHAPAEPGERYRFRLGAIITEHQASVEPDLLPHLQEYFDEVVSLLVKPELIHTEPTSGLARIARELAFAPGKAAAGGSLGASGPQRARVIAGLLGSPKADDIAAKQQDASSLGFTYLRPVGRCREERQGPGIASCDHLAWCKPDPAPGVPSRSRTAELSGRKLSVGLQARTDCNLYRVFAESYPLYRELTASASIRTALGFDAIWPAFEFASCSSPVNIFLGGGINNTCSITGF